MNISNALAASRRSFALLAPPDARNRGIFRRVSHNHSLFRRLQHEMQRLRGRLYLHDGAIGTSDLASDGRHVLATDDHSWHLLTLDASGIVIGCTRYLQHAAKSRFDDLRISNSALAESDVWGAKLRASVEEELATARAAGFSYVEVGGWAMDQSIRCTSECLRSVLATYAWSRIMGGAIGISTATERNGSAAILRRLGGRSLAWNGATLPPYYDPHYNCGMQILRYDSRSPNPRYEKAIEDLRETLLNVPVIWPEKPAWRTIIRGFGPIPDAPLLARDAMGAPDVMVHAA